MDGAQLGVSVQETTAVGIPGVIEEIADGLPHSREVAE